MLVEHESLSKLPEYEYCPVKASIFPNQVTELPTTSTTYATLMADGAEEMQKLLSFCTQSPPLTAEDKQIHVLSC